MFSHASVIVCFVVLLFLIVTFLAVCVVVSVILLLCYCGFSIVFLWSYWCLLSLCLLCFPLWPAAISPLLPSFPSSHSHAKVNGRVYLIMNRWVPARFLWHPLPSQSISESELPLSVSIHTFLPVICPCYLVFAVNGTLNDVLEYFIPIASVCRNDLYLHEWFSFSGFSFHYFACSLLLLDSSIDF